MSIEKSTRELIHQSHISSNFWNPKPGKAKKLPGKPEAPLQAQLLVGYSDNANDFAELSLMTTGQAHSLRATSVRAFAEPTSL